ncbi:hypothetical protein Mgra_00007574, partial [Meloidogyne graminicola]
MSKVYPLIMQDSYRRNMLYRHCPNNLFRNESGLSFDPSDEDNLFVKTLMEKEIKEIDILFYLNEAIIYFKKIIKNFFEKNDFK